MAYCIVSGSTLEPLCDPGGSGRSHQILSACSSGVLRVRPVQAQRATGDPVAHPGDEGSGSARRPQRSRKSPDHGVATSAT